MTTLFALADKIIDDSDPDTTLSQIHHALQTAEAARLAMPEAKYDWFHLTGFLHDLGKGPLAITKNYPQWKVVGDTFPMGCKVQPAVIFHDYYQENPDSKVEEYNTENGVYEPGCGFDKLVMSFGHDEYLASVLENNACTLPSESLYLIRFHSFYPWHQHQAYSHLASAKDRKNLEWLKRFQLCDLYSKVDVPVEPDKLLPYYKGLCDKYLGGWDRQLKL
jgi:inositol oxygenase